MSDRKNMLPRIRTLRETYGMGLHDAKTTVENYDFRKEIDQATTVDELKYVLDRLVNICFPTHGGIEDETLEEIWGDDLYSSLMPDAPKLTPIDKPKQKPRSERPGHGQRW